MNYLRIKVGELYATDPKLSLHLIRLMAATNDWNTIISIMGKLAPPQNELSRVKYVAQGMYFIRLSIGHLHEAILILKEFKRDCNHIYKLAPPEFNEKYERILKVIAPLEKKISRMRSKSAFHYDLSELEAALQQWGMNAEGDVIMGARLGEIRYVVADESFARTFCRAFTIPYDNAKEKKVLLSNLSNELISIQHGLSEFVLSLLEIVQRFYPNIFRAIEE